MPQWGRKSYARIPDLHPLPNLIEIQLDSFEWFKKEGLAELFDEISPIESFNKGMRLYFPGNSPEAREWGLKYWFETPKYGIEECLERDITFAAPLYVKVALVNRAAGDEVVLSEIFMGDFHQRGLPPDSFRDEVCHGQIAGVPPLVGVLAPKTRI